MASCSLEASNIKLSKLDLGRKRFGNLQRRNDIRTSIGRKQLQYAGVTTSYEPKKAFRGHCGAMLETEATREVNGNKETKPSSLSSLLIPNSSEIESLVTEICNTTSIAEFEMKVGGFYLRVTRDLTEKSKLPPIHSSALAPPSAAPAPAYAPISLDANVTAPDLNGSVSSTSLAISKPEPSPGSIQSLLDRSADEGIMILQSPRVGFFRRSRTIKGKRAPPSCKEKQIVKEGQVLCYIEQLGAEIPIESDVSGEVIKILREDGEPVGYSDALIAILPSFPGIKKLQ